MGVDQRVLRFQFSGRDVDVNVEVEYKSNMIDIVKDYEDRAREVGVSATKNPEFSYV